jgi:antitoxin (DNA-binding transcriptional repressor) of toxin-antitoxin stability system
MSVYSVAKIKSCFSECLRHLKNGEEVLITQHNKLVAKLVSLQAAPPLPGLDVSLILKLKPIKLKKGSMSNSALLRELREERKF